MGEPTQLGHSLIMLGAVLTGLLVRRFTAHTSPLPRRQRMAVLGGAFVGSALGAKVPFLFGDIDKLLNGLVWLSDGRTITWGLAGGYAGVEVAKWTIGLKAKTGDDFAVPVAASIAVGRLGCFYSGCCYGTATSLPWAVTFGDGIARHPTQLYEVIFHASAAVALWLLGRRGALPRQRIKLYMIAYFGYRLLTELIRPEPELALGLTFYQWSSLGFIAVLVALWRRDAGAWASSSGPMASRT